MTILDPPASPPREPTPIGNTTARHTRIDPPRSLMKDNQNGNVR